MPTDPPATTRRASVRVSNAGAVPDPGRVRRPRQPKVSEERNTVGAGAERDSPVDSRSESSEFFSDTAVGPSGQAGGEHGPPRPGISGSPDDGAARPPRAAADGLADTAVGGPRHTTADDRRGGLARIRWAVCRGGRRRLLWINFDEH
ncbi:hypothetical protein UA74_17350 [Actinoalloteichus fjordicus]|uniref:Uncharacterized protein n=1 Tax=Actinoalloteichus fjordicus TaxID=1612552 RepID=A0AAC9PSY1_9PSEU|nr:hypothetical protein UA74_17350 [Actinoalloteichus fjordicus]